MSQQSCRCRNCGSIDHNSWDCHEQKNVTAQIRCSNCGGMGHISLDCKATTFTPQENSATMDKEVSAVRCEVLFVEYKLLYLYMA